MNNTHAGMTIIEVLIYLGLISIIFSGCITTAYYLINTTQKVNAKIIENEEINFLIQYLNWACENINSVISPPPLQELNSFNINKNGYANNPINIFLQNGQIFLQTGTEPAISLTSQNLIKNFTVENKSVNNEQYIKIYFQTINRDYELIYFVQQ